MIEYLYEKAIVLYVDREKMFDTKERVREVERVVLLIDSKWTNHIDDMDILRQGIGLQSLGQKDPLVEYKIAAYDMFDSLVYAIKEDTVKIMFHLSVAEKIERKQVNKPVATNREETPKTTKVNTEKNIHPNEPCSCGSGKKYKNCHGRNI